MICADNHSETRKSDVNKNNNSPIDSLQEVAKGTAIVFIGTIVGMLFLSIGRILFARIFSSSEFGIFSLGVTLLNIFAVIGTLGLLEGATRQIAYYKGKNQIDKVQLVIQWSFRCAVLASIIIAFLVFLCSDLIANNVFNLPSLSFSLKILSIAIPFSVLISILSSIFRGFKRVKEKVYFLDIIRNILFPILLIPVIFLNMSFESGIVAYSLSIIITCFVFIIYYVKKKPISSKFLTKSKNITIGKELFIFSLPLLLVSILYMVLHWTDTLMLGYFTTPDVVGLYNAANPLGRFISISLVAMLFIYTPIVSDLYAKRKDAEMRGSYAILTKWLCAATLPLAMIFVFFPRIVINFVFGSEYLLASTVLQILALGFFINNLLGPNGATLTAMGKTKFLMGATFAAACINIGLNVILIPRYGINGAAIATISALVSINIIRSIKLYSISRIHSLKKNILKPIFLSGILFIFIYIIAKEFLSITFWMLPILFIFFIILYVASLLITKSFDREDIEMLLKIEAKTGIKLKLIKRILNKFI